MIRVYEIPQQVGPVGFLHGGGLPVPFLHVDWFGEDAQDGAPYPVTRPDLERFISGKNYRNPTRRYLVVADRHPDLTFVLEPQF